MNYLLSNPILSGFHLGWDIGESDNNANITFVNDKTNKYVNSDWPLIVNFLSNSFYFNLYPNLENYKCLAQSKKNI